MTQIKLTADSTVVNREPIWRMTSWSRQRCHLTCVTASSVLWRQKNRHPERAVRTLHLIGTLLIALTKVSSESIVTSLVWSSRTTSTSLIKGTGLKKCNPPKRSFLSVASAMAATEREEVFVANIVWLNKSKQRNNNLKKSVYSTRRNGQI